MEGLGRVIKLAWQTRKGLMLASSILMLLIAIIDLAYPWLSKIIIDLISQVISKKIAIANATNSLIFAGLAFLAVFLINDLFQVISNYISGKWWLHSEAAIRKKTFAHLLTLSMDFFEKEMVGKFKERLDKGIYLLQDVLHSLMLDIIPHLVRIIAAVAILASINPILTLIAFGPLPIFVWVSIAWMRKLNKLQDRARDYFEKSQGRAFQALVNIKTVKAFKTEKEEQKRFMDQVLQGIRISIDRFKKRTGLTGIRMLLVDASRLGVILFGGYLAINGQLTIGTLVLFLGYVSMAYEPLWYLTWTYDELNQNMRSVKRVFEMLDQKPLIIDDPAARPLKNVKGKIEISNVTFRYEKRNVLRNVDLTINPGEVVALVGPSGVGKTTILKLLLRFYDPSAGSIKIDGQDLRGLTQFSIRDNVAVVLQDNVMFNDTVINNILYGNAKASRPQAVEAAKLAYADEFIKNLPKKYDTIVGERGVKLSAGQAQRVAMARAFLKNAPILILDEATSQLDSLTERYVQKALWQLVKGRTAIIIAHRLSTVMQADKIIVLKNGRIFEQGTHRELLRTNGLYANLFKIQSGMISTRK